MSRFRLSWLVVIVTISSGAPSAADESDALPPGALARLGTLRLRHANKINAVAFSPNGKSLASAASNEPTARLWDVATGEEVRQFTSEGHELGAVAFTPDGKAVATGGTHARATLWDVATGKQVHRFGDEHSP